MRRETICHILVFLGLFAFQAIRLDCDPSPLNWMPEFNDEGYWNHSARCKTLFGTFIPDEFNQGVVASPLFTLIQWPIFSVCGVSILSARILPLVSLWLTMLMVYFLLRRCAPAGAALLAAAMLGALHEMLMYTKWSTPVITEACFLTAVFWFWELGRKGNRWWMAVSGASFVAAALTTLLAFHCLAGILLFLAISLLLRKEVDRGRVTLFLGSAGFLGLLVGVAYYLPNYDQVEIFVRTIARSNIVNTVDNSDSGYVRPSLLELPFQMPFGSPGVVPVMMIAALWLVDLVIRMVKQGVLPVLRKMPSVHLYCLCWGVGALPTLVITPYMPPRRFVVFLVPLVILASSFAWRVLAHDETDDDATRPSRLHRGLRFALWAIVAAVWCEYQWRADFAINSRWLYNASITFPQWITSLACVAAVIVAGVYYLADRTRASMLLLLVWFFGINLAITSIWYSHASYTVRDASREIRNYSKPREYLTNAWSWELALENECLPIFSPWDDRKTMNLWFIEESERVSFLASDSPSRNLINRFPRERVFPLLRMQLCPVIFAENEYRVERMLYRVEPSLGRSPATP